ncbi:MAG: alpha/beta fold hydrolase [Balneolaceae bacterium]
MRLLFFFLGLIVLFLPGKITAQITPSFTESKLVPVEVPDGQEYIFGYLEVPENRSDPNSIAIKLPVYIFKSRNEKPAPDPIIYTVGGPGSSSLSAARYMNYYQYLNDRDFILFEQRGTFYSKPSLNCSEWSETSDSYNYESAALDCRTRLSSEGIDLNGYRTTEIAADMEDLRKLLSIEQWNLLTISYSTKIAQVMMREYPETIRSVVMDSPLPLEVSFDEESAENLMEVLHRIFYDCSNQPTCESKFPNLKERFFDFIKEKNKFPIQLTVPDSKEIITYSGTEIALLLEGLSYEMSPMIPSLVKLLLAGDYSNLPTEKSNSSSFSDGIGLGMRLSVWCAEELPFASQEVIKNERTKYPEIYGYNPEVFSKKVCDNWNVAPDYKIENEAISSKIPTLVLSGSYDATTPLSWAEQINENLENSFLLVFSGWKHGLTTNWGNSCAMEAANQFFNNPENMPTSECIVEVNSFSFTTE